MSRLNSPKLTVLIGAALALVLAAAHFAPALMAPLEWLPH
jgi:preprotein translocase subunit Sec61beta